MNSIPPARQPRRVKARFIGPFALMLVFVMGVFAAAIYRIEASIRDRDLAERSAAVVKLFAQKLDKDTNKMMATLRALMINEALIEAFRRQDRGALAQQGGGLFRELSAEHKITHLYFIRPDLVSLFRFHSPAVFGDEIHRVTMLKAREGQQPAHGLELGPMGTLTLRLVAPWRQDGKLLGYLEVGEEIEHLIDEIRDSLGIDLLVLADKSFMTLDQWRRGMALLQRHGSWERFDSHAVLAQTARELPAGLDEPLLQRLLAGGTAEVHERGRSIHLASVPINDAGGRHLGDLVVMRDITALESTFQWSMIAVILISLLAAGGVLGVFFLALERVERDYRRQHDLEHRLLRLDSEHRRILQLEKLSAVGTMVGGIAHQLNNPLVGVVNLAELAEREADDPARTRELLREIRGAGEDCRDFVKRMLGFSKVSCFESKPTDMAGLIEDTVLLFRQAERRHLPVEVKLPEGPAVLTVDPVLIRHALFNLLVNAAQATPDGGEGIVIGLERGTDKERNLPGWTLSVADRGRGMPPEALEKIFEPFYATRSDGTGLGLPVVQHVALLHEGQVTVESEPGHGTRFAIWLPDPN
ncbi:MAG: histidine kinase [Rhodocyclaceae bacterium]|nr:histidine kinase [Rhodocyclaceae bacterium]